MEGVRRIVRIADRLLDWAICVVLALAFLYGGYAIWDNYMIYRRADVSYQIAQFKPTPSNPTLADLQAINPDVCAWITVDGTNIDYPVLHSGDNTRYLNNDLYGRYSLAGSIFLDYRNTPDFSDPYSILYGHHMDGGAMFGDVLDFENGDFFASHETGTLITSGRSCILEIYAVLHEDAYVSPMFDIVNDAYSYELRLGYIKQNALFYREIGITKKDRILAMSTCASATTNGRTIVLAQMVEDTDTGGIKNDK